jgi:hypothetical protein
MSTFAGMRTNSQRTDAIASFAGAIARGVGDGTGTLPVQPSLCDIAAICSAAPRGRYFGACVCPKYLRSGGA